MIYSLLLVVKYDPIFVDKYTKETTELLELVISFIFMVELLVRVIASGLSHSKNSYLRDPFNIFDFFLILMIGVSLTLQLIEFS